MRRTVLIALMASLALPVLAVEPDIKPLVKTTTSEPKPALKAGTGVVTRTVTAVPPALKPGEKLAEDDVVWPKWPTAEARSGLVELSKWLGQAHYLRVLCNGRSDQSWRGKMQSILDRDSRADSAFRAAMIEAFNTGYTALERDYPACSATVKEVETQTMTKAADAANIVARAARAHLKTVAEIASDQRTRAAGLTPAEDRKAEPPELR